MSCKTDEEPHSVQVSINVCLLTLLHRPEAMEHQVQKDMQALLESEHGVNVKLTKITPRPLVMPPASRLNMVPIRTRMTPRPLVMPPATQPQRI